MKKTNGKSSASASEKRKFWKLKFKKNTQVSPSNEGAYRVVKGSPVPTTNSKEKIQEAVVAAIY